MSSYIYSLNSAAELSLQVQDRNGVLADPTTLTLVITAPNGTTTTVTYAGAIVKDGVGLYHYDVTLSQRGTWLFSWSTSGGTPSPASKDGYLYVEKSEAVAQ